MATPTDIALVRLNFKWRDDFDLTDPEITSLLDAPMSVIDVCIWICDMYMARYTSEGGRITVGPITLDDSGTANAWNKLKLDLLARKNQGAGVPGTGGGSPLVAVGGASLGCTTPSEFWVGQFDNPPNTGSC